MADTEKKEMETDTKVEATEEGKEEKTTSLFDMPLEQSGKRQRKKVERMEYDEPKEKAPFKVVAGPGTAIADLPNVCHFLEKKKAEELVWLHRVMFGITAKKTLVKRHIRQFSGYPPEVTEEAKEKRLKHLTIKPIPQLKQVATMFQVSAGGKKQEIVDRIAEFLNAPYSSGKELPMKKKAAKSTAASKKKKKKSKSKKVKAVKLNQPKTPFMFFILDNKDRIKKENPKTEKAQLLATCRQEWQDLGEKGQEKYIKMSKEHAEKLNEENDNDDDDDDDDDDDEEEEEEKQKPKKKKPTKKRKATPKETEEDDEDEDDSDEDDDGPPGKKHKGEPSKATLRKAVASIVEKSDLDTVTKRMIRTEVQDKFPDFDLSSRKDFLNDCIANCLE